MYAFSLLTVIAPALNDKCSHATPITVGQELSVSLDDATFETSVYVGFCADYSIDRISGNALWYSFTGRGTYIILILFHE